MCAMHISHSYSLTHSLTHSLLLTPLQFDYGAAEDLQQFYNADVVVADMTDQSMWQSLFYHFGVRESLGRPTCVMTILHKEPQMTQQLRFTSKYEVVAYSVSLRLNDEGKTNK